MKLSRALSDLVYTKSVGMPDFEAQGEKHRKYMWKSLYICTQNTSCEIQYYKVDENGILYLGSRVKLHWALNQSRNPLEMFILLKD